MLRFLGFAANYYADECLKIVKAYLKKFFEIDSTASVLVEGSEDMLVESGCRTPGKQGLIDREELLPTQLSRWTVVLKINARKFLNVGSHRLVIKICNFCYTVVISGFPQGSVFGPILFLIYVNDIPEMVNCSIKMFADDTKLFKTVKSIDDCNILQNDLNTLSKLTNEWLLSCNAESCTLAKTTRS